MAYSFAYLEKNGVAITAGASSLVINVYKMNAGYTYDAILENQTVNADGTYNIVYSADGVYKITVKEGDSVNIATFADINYGDYLDFVDDNLPTIICAEDTCANRANIDNNIGLFLLAHRFFADNTYSPISPIDFTDNQVISELQLCYDAISRVSKYRAVLNAGTLPCC